MSFVAWPAALIVMSLPFGGFALCTVMLYYLIAVADWNPLLALVFVCPGVLWAFLGAGISLTCTVSSLLSGKRD